MWISHGFTQDDGRFADTRSYDFLSAIWTDRTPSGDVPVKRCLHDCFWSAGGRLILYGGQTTGVAALGDIWTFDPAAGAGRRNSSRLRRLVSSTRWHPTLVSATWCSVAAALTVAFSETHGPSTGADRSCTLLSSPPAPSARAGATLIVDPAGRYLLFGGTNQDGLLGDLWDLSQPE